MKSHAQQKTEDRVKMQLSVWISGLTFAVVLLLGGLIIDIKTDISVIQYQLKDLNSIDKTVTRLERKQDDIKVLLKALNNEK